MYIVEKTPLFSQPWWLDIVAPGSWGEVLIREKGDTIARMPYVKEKRFGFKLLNMPLLTPYLGPWLRPSVGKYVTQLSQQMKMFNDLIEQLPVFDYFIQNIHYTITNWLPFYWKGFKQTTQYTYVIDDLSDINLIWENTDSTVKGHINKAQKLVTVHSNYGINKFLDLNELTFKRQGLSLPYSREFITRMDNECSRRNCRRMFFAEDTNGRLHSAIYIVWDNQSAYYLMGGSDPELRRSGANILLLWEAIKYSASFVRCFNFEGSMIKGVESVFRSFGARLTPYYQIYKINSLPLKIYLGLKR